MSQVLCGKALKQIKTTSIIFFYFFASIFKTLKNNKFCQFFFYFNFRQRRAGYLFCLKIYKIRFKNIFTNLRNLIRWNYSFEVKSNKFQNSCKNSNLINFQTVFFSLFIFLLLHFQNDIMYENFLHSQKWMNTSQNEQKEKKNKCLILFTPPSPRL